jgi:hypothetical protein
MATLMAGISALPDGERASPAKTKKFARAMNSIVNITVSRNLALLKDYNPFCEDYTRHLPT